jgi:hypothetical protein
LDGEPLPQAVDQPEMTGRFHPGSDQVIMAQRVGPIMADVLYDTRQTGADRRGG